ncbi:glutamate N-acetyltransferase/amino-acid acetyltransferase [Lichtheimia ornata]|uniref:Arginine biosynthesis bifunctional protein ArgJ, mitochondrial n=1 Tax=Lichtheimia ornata TaxID=688661 RepID=A0AAD7UWL2_9FUNG|nr:glutamate N-acetyltransferase/amino-acid acetyltransferase [Lichtheimia ornata]KAJ8654179.1 glutamate N-acetyltransferase/amino-acid acetyltransferase [Lichtheimia ornata]
MFRLPSNLTRGNLLRQQFQRYTSSYAHLQPSKQSLIPSSGVYPLGFRAGGVHAGVKKNGNKDIALIVSDRPCAGAAVFTTNAFKAAPVLVSQETLQENSNAIFAVVTNSGCANAVTGAQGLENARRMRSTVDNLVEHPMSALTMSTGVIGQQLPIDKIEAGIKHAYTVLSSEHDDGWFKCAEAFMTTDTFPKLKTGQFAVDDKKVTMAGIAKGAGMIHPNMATLLGFMVTDAYVEPALLKKTLKYATDRSFNSISVDGDMSTNDTIAVLANGASGVRIESEDSPAYELFRDQLTSFAAELAQLIVRDGEGATKFVTIHVKGAKSFEDAKQAASHISTSMLVKTALYGQDANWGRICASLGHCGVDVDASKVSVNFVPADGSEKLKLMVTGEPEQVDEDRAAEILKFEDLTIEVDLNLGDSETKFWTCDLSHEYVTINGDYRS